MYDLLTVSSPQYPVLYAPQAHFNSENYPPCLSVAHIRRSLLSNKVSLPHHGTKFQILKIKSALRVDQRSGLSLHLPDNLPGICTGLLDSTVTELPKAS
jgi:hypothetical protein